MIVKCFLRLTTAQGFRHCYDCTYLLHFLSCRSQIFTMELHPVQHFWTEFFEHFWTFLHSVQQFYHGTAPSSTRCNFYSISNFYFISLKKESAILHVSNSLLIWAGSKPRQITKFNLWDGSLQLVKLCFAIECFFWDQAALILKDPRSHLSGF